MLLELLLEFRIALLIQIWQIGPFIDAKHPSIRWGDTELTPKEIFRDNISSRLSHLLQSSTSTTAILVPSLNDVLNQHVAFPQGPFAKDPELGLPKVSESACKDDLVLIGGLAES